MSTAPLHILLFAAACSALSLCTDPVAHHRATPAASHTQPRPLVMDSQTTAPVVRIEADATRRAMPAVVDEIGVVRVVRERNRAAYETVGGDTYEPR